MLMKTTFAELGGGEKGHKRAYTITYIKLQKYDVIPEVHSRSSSWFKIKNTRAIIEP